MDWFSVLCLIVCLSLMLWWAFMKTSVEDENLKETKEVYIPFLKVQQFVQDCVRKPIGEAPQIHCSLDELLDFIVEAYSTSSHPIDDQRQAMLGGGGCSHENENV